MLSSSSLRIGREISLRLEAISGGAAERLSHCSGQSVHKRSRSPVELYAAGRREIQRMTAGAIRSPIGSGRSPRRPTRKCAPYLWRFWTRAGAWRGRDFDRSGRPRPSSAGQASADRPVAPRLAISRVDPSRRRRHADRELFSTSPGTLLAAWARLAHPWKRWNVMRRHPQPRRATIISPIKESSPIRHALGAVDGDRRHNRKRPASRSDQVADASPERCQGGPPSPDLESCQES